METTALIEADDMAVSFNAVPERNYWRASAVSSRSTGPYVLFKSRSSMIELSFHMDSKRYSVAFTKVACSFGDFTSSTYKALTVIMSALKAAGFPVGCPVDDQDGVLRMEFDPRTKLTYVTLAKTDDEWPEYEK